MIKLEAKHQKQLVKTICETMASICLQAEDTHWNQFSGGTGETTCESLASQLDLLGVHEIGRAHV